MRQNPHDILEDDQFFPWACQLRRLVIINCFACYLVPSGILLMSYCADIGCFRHGCGGLRPNQCLPPVSDTFLDFSADASAHLRRHLWILSSFLRTIFFLVVWMRSYWFLVPSWFCRFLFTIGVLLQVVLDTLSAWLPDAGGTAAWHTLVSIAELATCMLVVLPLFASALCVERGACSRSILIVWTFWFGTGMQLLWLLWSWDMTNWSWYVCEWAAIATLDFTILAMGVALPSTMCFRINVKRPCWCVCEIIRRQVVHPSEAAAHDDHEPLE